MTHDMLVRTRRGSITSVLAACALALLLSWAPVFPADAQDQDWQTLDAKVGELYAQGRYAEAIEAAKAALTVAERKHGPEHTHAGTSLNDLAALYRDMDDYVQAELFAKRALEIKEKVFGPDHPEVGNVIGNLGQIYLNQDRYGESEPLLKRQLAIAEKHHGPNHPLVATSLRMLAGLHRAQGKLDLAEPLLKRAVEIRLSVLGPKHRDYATSLGLLGEIYRLQGRYAEAEPLLKQAVIIREEALGRSHRALSINLHDLAYLYFDTGKYREAEPLFRRALAIDEKSLGPDHPGVATKLHNLALVLKAQRRYSEAEPLIKRSLAIYTKVFGPDHPHVGASLNNLANLYSKMGRQKEAERLMGRDKEISGNALGRDHPDYAGSLNELGVLKYSQGKLDEAQALYTESLTIKERTLGPDHPEVATTLNNLAWVAFSKRDWKSSVERWRRSTGIYVKRAVHGTTGSGSGDGSGPEATRYGWNFRALVKVSHRLAAKDVAQGPVAARETFETAQWVQASEAAQTLSQMAARGAAGDAALAALVRERQDLVGEWHKLDAERIAAVSESPEKRDAKAEAETATRLTAIDTRLAEIDARLAKDFPDFAGLGSPAPISVSDVQALVGPDEALVLFLDTGDNWKPVLAGETFIWVVTKDKLQWAKSDIGTKELAGKVARFRKPLDLWAQAPRGLARLDADSAACAPDARGLARTEPRCTESTAFSLKLAHELYAKLLGLVADTIKDKQHLILVPSGPLTGLPFNALLTEPPPAGKATLATMKAAPWIVRRHALTILPSASSLKALRRGAKTSGAAKPFVGFGNPDFRGKSPGGRPSGRGSEDKLDEGESPGTSMESGKTRVATRGVSDYFRGALADVETLRGALPPLPDTADELKSIGMTLAAAEDDIMLGQKASETTVKAMSADGRLASYNVVAFATHGLVAGQLKGLAEPAIALTVPETASEADDGLLTASEAATLKLDADWVLLSACNTAAGGEPGAEALSGLSRAFFYAGTRALLVSHWEVESSAAVRLTTGTFAALKANPGLGRSQAFRQSMLDLIDSGAPHEAHPAHWAPFFVVGEGRAGR